MPIDSAYIVIGLIIGFEILSVFIFWTVALVDKKQLSLNTVLKGILERTFITFALVVGYPQALTFFAALKIATRIKDESKISNDYYLIGNLVSVSLALLYSLIINKHIVS